MFNFDCLGWSLISVTLAILPISTLSSRGNNTCSTPPEWLQVLENLSSESGSIEENSGSGSEDLISPGAQMWPGGIVKYEFDSSLDETDRDVAHQAFDEYHSKTCIRFKQWNPRDPTFHTKIIQNSSYCGLGTVCYTRNSFAMFGGHCRNKATLVHELGHNLCLSHEHQRKDRDDYISLVHNEYCQTSAYFYAKLSTHYAPVFYDYASQMHYCCSGNCCIKPKEKNVPGCSDSQHQGLSVLDADMLNDMYECSNCLRHRWISIDKLDMRTLTNFSFFDSKKSLISPCRSNVGYGKEIAVGTYHHNSRVCKLTYEGKVIERTSQVEVLVIPNGLQHKDDDYQFAEAHNVLPYNLLPKAVPGGYLMGPYEVQYIAVFSQDGSAVFGKVTASSGRLTAKFPVGKKEIVEKIFSVLICSNQYLYSTTVKPTVVQTEILEKTGCGRHKWKTIRRLDSGDILNFPNYGYLNKLNRVVYPCRLFTSETVIIGEFNVETKLCTIIQNGKSFDTESAQVLLIPGKPYQTGSNYQLLDVNYVNKNNLVDNAVSGGYSDYIGYVKHNDQWTIGTGVLKDGKFIHARVIADGLELIKTHFLVMVCVEKFIYSEENFSSNKKTRCKPKIESTESSGVDVGSEQKYEVSATAEEILSEETFSSEAAEEECEDEIPLSSHQSKSESGLIEKSDSESVEKLDSEESIEDKFEVSETNEESNSNTFSGHNEETSESTGENISVSIEESSSSESDQSFST